MNINRRRLEFASDAETVDFRHVHLGQIRIAILTKLHLAGVWPGATGDDIHHRAFAGTVRTDDGAQLALIHVEIQVVDRLEPIEGFIYPFKQQNKFFNRRGHSGLTG